MLLNEKEIVKRSISYLKGKNPWLQTFEDLKFEEHFLSKEYKKIGIKDNSKYSEQAKINYENEGYISVVIGENFYSNGIDTYEVFTSKISDPYGHLVKEEVSLVMIQFQIENPKLLIIERESIPQIQNMFPD